MAKANEPIGEVEIQLLREDGYASRTAPLYALLGPLAIHHTVEDQRLAEAKTAAWSVSHTASGLGLINGVQTRKAAVEFAEQALEQAQALGLTLEAGGLEELRAQAEPWEKWLAWALEARAQAKTRKGFLYD